MRKIVLYLNVICLTASAQVPIPKTMGALGDSMTAAALASTTIPANIFSYLMNIYAPSPFSQDRPTIQDTSFKSWSWIIENKSLSWATGGDAVHSHAAMLSSIEGSEIVAKNFAISGYTSLDVLNDEIPTLQAWAKNANGGRYPNYVTLLIGANDICQNTINNIPSTIAFQGTIAQIIHVLMTDPDTYVLISALPPIDTLYAIAQNEHYFGYMSCKELWQKTRECPTLTSPHTPEEQATIHGIIQGYNSALKSVADYYPGRVKYAGTIASVQFTPDDLAIDCFHPNILGQRMISNATWNDGFWPNY